MNVKNSLEKEILITYQKGTICSGSYAYGKVTGTQALVL